MKFTIAITGLLAASIVSSSPITTGKSSTNIRDTSSASRAFSRDNLEHRAATRGGLGLQGRHYHGRGRGHRHRNGTASSVDSTRGSVGSHNDTPGVRLRNGTNDSSDEGIDGSSDEPDDESSDSDNDSTMSSIADDSIDLLANSSPVVSTGVSTATAFELQGSSSIDIFIPGATEVPIDTSGEYFTSSTTDSVNDLSLSTSVESPVELPTISQTSQSLEIPIVPSEAVPTGLSTPVDDLSSEPAFEPSPSSSINLPNSPAESLGAVTTEFPIDPVNDSPTNTVDESAAIASGGSSLESVVASAVDSLGDATVASSAVLPSGTPFVTSSDSSIVGSPAVPTPISVVPTAEPSSSDEDDSSALPSSDSSSESNQNSDNSSSGLGSSESGPSNSTSILENDSSRRPENGTQSSTGGRGRGSRGGHGSSQRPQPSSYGNAPTQYSNPKTNNPKLYDYIRQIGALLPNSLPNLPKLPFPAQYTHKSSSGYY